MSVRGGHRLIRRPNLRNPAFATLRQKPLSGRLSRMEGPDYSPRGSMMRQTMQIKFSGFFPAVLFAVCLLATRAAADDLFTVSGVHVDASGASSHEAFTVALQQGRPKAWTTLFRRLTRQQDWTKQPALDAPALEHLSRGYTLSLI